MELQLLKEKLQRVQAVVQQWLGQKAAKQRDLESLVGLLQHVVKVVCSGCSFVQCIIQLMRSVKNRDRFNTTLWKGGMLKHSHGTLPSAIIVHSVGEEWSRKLIRCHCDNMHCGGPQQWLSQRQGDDAPPQMSFLYS